VQVVQAWGVGEFGFTLFAVQVLQSEAVPPEQVAQSPWQPVHVVSLALNWLLVQSVQLPGVGEFAFTFIAIQGLHSVAAGPEQVAQSA
jgi:hypothetical protein